VLIEDARHNGHHLRVTWHPDNRQFVVSTWVQDVCTGSARVAVEDAGDLTNLLVDGVTEAASRPTEAAAVPPGTPGLGGLLQRLQWLVRGTPPVPPTADPGRAPAPVRPLRRRPA
jgi:hypothetical protein